MSGQGNRPRSDPLPDYSAVELLYPGGPTSRLCAVQSIPQGKPTDRVRERSNNTKKVFDPIEDEEEYYEAQCTIYPPDGYFNIQHGKKRRKLENRPHPKEWKGERDAYKGAQKVAEKAYSKYTTQNAECREAEEQVGVPAMYENVPDRMKKGNSTGIYLAPNHRALQPVADEVEEKYYDYATKRNDHFEKYPRSFRTSTSEKGHYNAVGWAWNDHKAALDTRNSHASAAQELEAAKNKRRSLASSLPKGNAKWK